MKIFHNAFSRKSKFKKKKKIKLIKENLLGSWFWKAQRTYFLKPIFENLLRKQFVKHLLKTSSKARFVIVFKNYCLKRCENCGLKSVVEKHVFSVSKKKKMCLVSWFK